MKKKTYILIFLLVAAIALIAGFFAAKKVPQLNDATRSQFNGVNKQGMDINKDVSDNIQQPINNSQEEIQKQTVNPMSNPLARITKKPFGIYVSPKNSTVQPERFIGYHNAVDLEALPEEQDVEVAVKALCDGKLLLAKTASGYGGVAVQSCTLDEQEVTIVYGHIDLATMKVKINNQLRAGDFLANLGAGFSSQTDGERKHLHLGIHKGKAVNILGYVQTERELSAWLDPQKYLN